MSLADRAAGSPRAFGSRRFAGFLLTGGTAALVNIASCRLLSVALPFEAAVVAAYLVGMVCAFALAKLFVFDESGRPVSQEFARFAAVNAVALAQVWLVSVGLAQHLFPNMGFVWHGDTTAHVLGVLTPALTSYLGHMHFTFRDVHASGR